jgi:aspartyl-tRNA(Asn)/glutamyl-tRNA(Gln) amidotransferase subunit A
VKDLIDVAGLPAEYGSLTLKGNIAAADAPSVERLRRAGAIILGKTTTSEFGYRGYTKSLAHGNTRNPWNLTRTPGGSSGGAVASVAAGITAIALGTDGGGSIRSPCALTGLVGIKPTSARIPVWPASATPTLAHVGPVARNVADAVLLLHTCAGPDRRDPFSLMAPIGDEPPPAAIRKLRVAFSPTLGYAKVDAAVSTSVAAAVKLLEGAFANIERIEAVCEEEGDVLGAEFIGGCSARLGDLVESHPETIDQPLLAAIRDFRHITADSYTRLLRRRLAHRERMREFFERFDILLTPTTPCTAWSIDAAVPPGHEIGVWSYFTYPFNLSGQPSASLPCGSSPEGLPIGLQLTAPLCGEGMLIGAMRFAETALASVAMQVPIEPRTLR